MIYLDHHATTPVDPRITEVITTSFLKNFANPSSPHRLGWEAAAIIKNSRSIIAEALGAFSDEIFFCSGATESISTIISQSMSAKNGAFITSTIEHTSTFNSAEALINNQKYELQVDKHGYIILDSIPTINTNDKNRPHGLASIIGVHNEFGVVQDLFKLTQQLRALNYLVHLDLSQSIGRININLHKLGVSYATFCPHKAYGPKGIGVTFIKRGLASTDLSIAPSDFGALKGGTLPVPLIHGAAATIKIITEEQAESVKQIQDLTKNFHDQLTQTLPGLRLNGPPGITKRAAGNLHYTLPNNKRSEDLIAALASKVAFSATSACLTNINQSKALQGLGLTPEEISGSFRLCVGKFNTQKEITEAAQFITKAILDL